MIPSIQFRHTYYNHKVRIERSKKATHISYSVSMCAGIRAGSFTHTISLISSTTLEKGHYQAHFTDVETELPRGHTTFPSSPSWRVVQVTQQLFLPHIAF